MKNETPPDALPKSPSAGNSRSPEVRYARSGEVSIAYQTIGDGPIDLIMARHMISQLEVSWEEPSAAAQFHEFARFSRVILFDKRGTGLSDRDVGVATLEDRMDDLRAVLDAVGSPRAVLFGARDGAPLCALFAATYPDRTLGQVLWGGMAAGTWAPDYPWARRPEEWDRAIALHASDWGSPAHAAQAVEDLAPSRRGDPEFARWMGKVIRAGASPSSARQLLRMIAAIDLRAALPAVHVPTLVLHAEGDRVVPVECGRDLARRIPGARFETFPGPDHIWWVTNEGRVWVTRMVRSFVESLNAIPESDRVLTTVLFTDIVDSTKTARELGDQAWGALLDGFLTAARDELRKYRGVLVKTTGDGLLATFDGPNRAVRCAASLRRLAQGVHLATRTGIHAGECLMKSQDVQGIAVHIASRVAEAAARDEILVSGTVRDLCVGSTIEFRSAGERTLRGVDEPWRVYSAVPLAMGPAATGS